MNKKLSKQICELCGIEPIYQYTTQAFKTPHISVHWGKKALVCYLMKILHTPESRKYYKFLKFEKIYPDFGKPELFVKLIELKPLKTHKPLFGEVTALTYFFNKTAFVLNCREDFLRMLLNTINGYSDDFISKSSQEKIKQAIKQEFGGGNDE